MTILQTTGQAQRAERLQHMTAKIETLRENGSVCQHLGVRDNGYRLDRFSAGVQATCSFANVCRFQYRLQNAEAGRDCGCIRFRGSDQPDSECADVAVHSSHQWPGYAATQPQPLPNRAELIEYSRVLLNDYSRNFAEQCAAVGYEAAIFAIRHALVQGQPGMCGPGSPKISVNHGDVCISNIHSRTLEITLNLTIWLRQMLPDPSKPVQHTMF